VDEEIQRQADADKSDVVVMGTHGRRVFEQWLMGSVTQRVMRQLNVPLLTLTAAKQIATGTGFRRILVATDFSQGVRDAVTYAFSIAQESHASVTVLHAIDDVSADLDPRYREPLILGVQTQLEKLVPQGVRDWCEVRTRVETGVPFSTILKVVMTGKFDLLVMNTHGQSMLDRALLGSTVERVVRSASCPVLLIPPTPKGLRKRKRLA
jgi:nucleotide-binding universal stress UspA family protein